MTARLASFGSFAVATMLARTVPAAVKPAELPGEPKLTSLYPFTAHRGSVFTSTVRGTGLRDATAVFAPDAPLSANIEGLDTAPPKGREKTASDLVRLRIQLDATAKPGRYPIRLITPHGLSNALTLHVVEHPTTLEPEGSHETPETAIPVQSVPAIFSGRIARRGESDCYVFDAKAGQILTFEAISGLPSIGAAGGNAAGFDPSLTLYERSGSWFDAARLNRIAFNDEPLWVIGQLTDAYLIHKFEKAGRYFIRIEAFSGQGGPDYSYELKIQPRRSPAGSRAGG